MRTIILLLLLLPSLSFADCANRVDSMQSIDEIKVAFSCFKDKIQALNNEIIELKRQLNDSQRVAPINPVADLPKANTSKTQIKHEIKYELVGCYKKSDKVKCELIITRLGKNLYFYILYSGTIIHDTDGNVYNVTDIKLGKSYKNNKKFIRTLLISNSMAKVILQFKRVPVGVTRLSLLKIQVRNNNGSSASFHNIDLKK